MALFTRQDAEELREKLQELRHLARECLLDGTAAIHNINISSLLNNCDSAEDSIPKKLAATRMILQDRENMMKSRWFAFVIPRAKGWLIRRASRQWKPTTEAEVARLENSGVTIVYYKARSPEDRQKPQAEQPLELEFEPLHWERKTVLEGMVLSKQGFMVRWVGEGESRYCEVSIPQDDQIEIAVGVSVVA